MGNNGAYHLHQEEEGNLKYRHTLYSHTIITAWSLINNVRDINIIDYDYVEGYNANVYM